MKRSWFNVNISAVSLNKTLLLEWKWWVLFFSVSLSLWSTIAPNQKQNGISTVLSRIHESYWHHNIQHGHRMFSQYCAAIFTSDLLTVAARSEHRTIKGICSTCWVCSDLTANKPLQGSKGIKPKLCPLRCFVPHQSATAVFRYVQTNRAKEETPPCFRTKSQV